jgi:prepilin-type N-terminal cleavage/methylation domain-containing protein
MLTRVKTLFNKGQDRGFTLIELLIVILIVGILAAVATPLYLGYVKDAKTAEAKAVAGSLWSSVQANAISNCGVDTTVASGYPKAGLTSSGTTTPVRWSISQTGGPMNVTCNTGAYTPDGTLFTIAGAVADVSFVRVQMVYTAAGTPPSQLKCSTDGGGTYANC